MLARAHPYRPHRGFLLVAGCTTRSPTTRCAPPLRSHLRNRRSRSRRPPPGPRRRGRRRGPRPRLGRRPGPGRHAARRRAVRWAHRGAAGRRRPGGPRRLRRHLRPGETGMMGLALDPGFAGNRRFYSCQGVVANGRTSRPASIAVIAWTVAPDWSSATRVADPLIGGIPVNERSGRRGGCRLRFDEQGALLIGTGDNAVGTNPQDPRTWAGKVLLADAMTGEVAVWTLGHRNVQGLAVRPGTGQVFSVEHGPDRDDEVNLLREGGNYGWDPDGDRSYDESVPMTTRASRARSRRSGRPGTRRSPSAARRSSTATTGATTTVCSSWGCSRPGRPGAAAGRRRRPAGAVPAARAGGPLRPHPERAPGRGRALYVTTDNGSGSDRVLRVTARG